jgi:hypothetical protein
MSSEAGNIRVSGEWEGIISRGGDHRNATFGWVVDQFEIIVIRDRLALVFGGESGAKAHSNQGKPCKRTKAGLAHPEWLELFFCKTTQRS